MKLTNNHYGRFEISCEFLKLNPSLLSRVFAKLAFVPLTIWWDGRAIVQYSGLSPLFRELKDGAIVPSYKVTISQKKKLEVSVDEISGYPMYSGDICVFVFKQGIPKVNGKIKRRSDYEI